MSKTTDRLDQIQEGTAPLPWPPEFFYNMPDAEFMFLYALSQAYSALRAEVLAADAGIEVAIEENRNYRVEHGRIAEKLNVMTAAAATINTYHDATVRELRDKLTAMTADADQLRAELNDLPLRTAAAERVCDSIDTQRSGSGGQYAYYDVSAHNEWKKVAR
jgi:hypothetical protein